MKSSTSRKTLSNATEEHQGTSLTTKVGKSTSDLKQDEQLAYSNRLAVVRARAMAFILSRSDDHINIDEVHIVIGPKI